MKKKESSHASGGLTWRPNFRDTNTLPDVKTVRTNFFVSVVAVAVAAMSVMHVGFHEYGIFSSSQKLNSVMADIEANQSDYGKAVSLNKKFEESYQRIEEIKAFVEGQMIASDLLVDISRNLMPGMSVLSVQYQESKTTIIGYVVANEETDSLLKEYVERLRSIDTLKDRYDQFNQVSLSRKPGSSQIEFHLEAVRSDEEKSSSKK